MTLVDTWASTAAGAFALSENNLYTVEAFREYFDHLKPDGYIAITRWEFARPREALRVVAQAMRALDYGLQKRSNEPLDLRKHFIIVVEGDFNQDGRPSPFSPRNHPSRPKSSKSCSTIWRSNRNSTRSIFRMPTPRPKSIRPPPSVS